MKLSAILNLIIGVLMTVQFSFQNHAQNRRFISRRVPNTNTRFSRVSSNRRIVPMTSQRRLPQTRQISSRQLVSRRNLGSHSSGINSLSNAILLSALLGIDMPQERRSNSRRMILSRLLGIDLPQSNQQSPFSGLLNTASSNSIGGTSFQVPHSPSSFGEPVNSVSNLLPGHNLVVQSGQNQVTPVVIEAGGKIKVSEITKPNGQKQVIIDASQSKGAAAAPAATVVKTTTKVVPALNVNALLSNPPVTRKPGEDPPEIEMPPLQELARLTKLLQGATAGR